MLQEYYKSVTGMLQECYMSTTRGLQVLHKRHNTVNSATLVQDHYKSATGVSCITRGLQKYYRSTIRHVLIYCGKGVWEGPFGRSLTFGCLGSRTLQKYYRKYYKAL